MSVHNHDEPTNIDVKFGRGGIMKHPGSVDYRIQGKMSLVEWILQLNLSLDDGKLDEIKKRWRCLINGPERKRIVDSLISSLIFKGGRFFEREKTTKHWFVVYDQGRMFNTTAKMLDDQIKKNVFSLVRLACRVKTCEASNHQGSLPVRVSTPVVDESFHQFQHTSPIQQPRREDAQEIFSSQCQLSQTVSHHTPQEYSQELDQSSTCHQMDDYPQEYSQEFDQSNTCHQFDDYPTYVDCPDMGHLLANTNDCIDDLAHDDNDALLQSLFDNDKWLDN
jgi:hypothetical protein